MLAFPFTFFTSASVQILTNAVARAIGMLKPVGKRLALAKVDEIVL